MTTAPAVQTGAVMKEKQQVPSKPETSTQAAIEAMRRGYQAVAIYDGTKRPLGSAWTHQRWESEEQIRASFERWRTHDGASGIGLVLGEPSNGLIDVDLDHPKSMRLKDYFLPPTPMQTGRPGRPRSHRWYRVEGDLPSTRRYTMPDKSVSIELRSTGGQTLIPPSIWYPKEKGSRPTEPYRWEGQPWGGKKGPALVDGRKLAVQVALTAMASVLLEAWPGAGSRHDAYLALAGGLLRFGESVHPYWERNLSVLISALADVTNDDDGPEVRVSESVNTTLERLRAGEKAVGFPRLAEIIGTDHAEQARRLAREVEQLAGHKPESTSTLSEDEGPLLSTLPPEIRNPLEERVSTWESIDLEPYLAGEVTMPEPAILRRTDGKGLFYPGRVNQVYGLSEGGKTWIAMTACTQEMGIGERVVYVDLEDEPAGAISRMRLLGAGDDDIKYQFRYVLPDGPLADMQRYRFGHQPTEDGTANANVFRALLKEYDPTLVIIDGMTSLYGMHGHDTNDAGGTDIITTWLKSLCRGGRTTVIVIDHTGKGGGAGTSPIGAHHKVAMVQGTSLRVDVAQRPMIGELGIMHLVVYKDRPGAVRAISTKDSEQVAGIVYMDSTKPGRVEMRIEPPNEGGQFILGATPEMEAKMVSLSRSQALQDAIIALFEGDVDKELTTTDVLEAMPDVQRDEVYDAWRALLSRDEVVQEGTRRWTRFHLPRPETTDEEGEEG